ncbi:MAG: SsrA-binding protein SmpB [Candidatus Omnitrophota bacterium]
MSSVPVISNRKAYHDYHIFEKIDCGIELKGQEVKSLREGKVSLADSFARIDNGELFLYNTHIAQYEKTGAFKVEPLRVRKLLLHRNQIDKLAGSVSQKGWTLIPLRIYFNERGIAKLELALAKGKREYDKRESIKKREVDLEIKKAMSRK